MTYNFMFQSRLGDFGIEDPKTNKLFKTPLWALNIGEKTKMGEENLPEMEVVEVKEFDVSKYVGMKSTIKEISLKTGNFGKYLKIDSNILGKTEDGKDVKASMVFSVKETKTGFAISKSGDLNKLMNNKKVSDYRDLMNKDIVIISKADDKGRDWLIFN